MHTYSTDNENRPHVYGYIALGAYLLAIIVGAVISFVASYLPIVVGIGLSWGIAFKILLNVYDKHVWNTAFAEKLKWTKVPDLNGTWEGYVETSYSDHIDEKALHPDNDPSAELQMLKASLHIRQTYRKINVHLETETSTSDSDGATILADDGRWSRLSYQYGNDPNPNTEGTMHPHYGSASLVLRETDDNEELTGPYYTDQNRRTYGEMYFKRVKNT